MTFSKQLRKYREQAGLSQEKLAEKIFVSRQTISKWENEKTYPDLQSLLSLSELFNITLDELVKGDVDMMKDHTEKGLMDRLTYIMLIFMILAAISCGPALKYGGAYWFVAPFILWAISMVAALKIDRLKKKNDIKTYQEILAYMADGDVEEAISQRDNRKHFWTKTLIILFFVVIVVLVMLGSIFLF